MLFDANMIEMAMQPGKKPKENPVGPTGEVKDEEIYEKVRRESSLS